MRAVDADFNRPFLVRWQKLLIQCMIFAKMLSRFCAFRIWSVGAIDEFTLSSHYFSLIDATIFWEHIKIIFDKYFICAMVCPAISNENCNWIPLTFIITKTYSAEISCLELVNQPDHLYAHFRSKWEREKKKTKWNKNTVEANVFTVWIAHFMHKWWWWGVRFTI